MKDRKTIAVDFDGVLHQYQSPWTSHEEIHDEPVLGAVPWLKRAQEFYDVVIYSVRASTPAGKLAIAKWLKRYGFPEGIEITADKPRAIIYLDDRAWRFNGTFPEMNEINSFKPWNK